MEKFCSSKTLLKMAGGEVHAYFFRYSFYAVGDTFFLHTTQKTYQQRLYLRVSCTSFRLGLFSCLVAYSMFGRRVVVFLKFLVHFVLAKPTADSDFLRMKDMSQRILQTVHK